MSWPLLTILTTIFLGEIFTPIKYLGIFLLVIGAVSISSKNFRHNFNFYRYSIDNLTELQEYKDI